MDSEKPTWELRDENQALWGTVWWNKDKKKIESDTPKILTYLRDIHHSGKSFEDGLEFLEVIPRYFRSGYVTMNKVS